MILKPGSDVAAVQQTVSNGLSKLANRGIITLHNQLNNSRVARDYGVSYETVRRIVLVGRKKDVG